MANFSLRNVLLRGVSFTAVGALTCFIFVLFTSFAPPQDAGMHLPEAAAEVEGEDKDGNPPPPPEGGRNMLIRVFLQGYYLTEDQGDKKLRRARDFVDGQIRPRWDHPLRSDVITVRLHDPENYNTVLHTVENLILLTNGYTTEFRVPRTVNGTDLEQVWISVRHRNHLETVWHKKVDISVGELGFEEETIILDFTTEKLIDGEMRDPSYGENQHQFASGDFAIYAGDSDQDGEINAADRSMVQSHLLQISRGYQVEDINGDGEVNASDRSLVQSNLLQIVRRRIPVTKTNNIE